MSEVEAEAVSQDQVLATAKRLSEAGIVSEREAQAYLLLEVIGQTGRQAKDVMNRSQSRAYSARNGAQEKIRGAVELLNLLEEIETTRQAEGEIPWLDPQFCSKCGEELQRWTCADGHVMCLSCADV
jgi:hypothetical protein